MASCISLLSEDKLMCSICLEVFNDPISTPCGHNFCKACINKYWDSNALCQCPVCKKTFDKRPDLCINTFISELAAPFKESVPVKAANSQDQRPAKHEVSCDFCTGTKSNALKSCVVCLTSYCETHLEPHMRITGLRKHKLIDPVTNLEDRMCKKHERPLELFCRTDQKCVCQFCTETDHKTHKTVPVEVECEERKTRMKKTDGVVQKMLQERLEKVQEIKRSLETSKRAAKREISDSVKVFTALVSSIQRSQAEVVEVIEEKQKAAEKRAERFITELEQEITELKRRSSELEQLSHSEDHLHLLQSFPSLSTPPKTKDWSQICVRNSVGTIMRVVSQLEKTLIKDTKTLCEAELKTIQQSAVDVTLDSDTSHPNLVLSEDGKIVRYADVTNNNLPNNPKRFDPCLCVLGKQSISSGRFYYEVQVGVKPGWKLGVVRESINRKGKITVSRKSGLWILLLRNGEYSAATVPPVLLSLREKPQKVGVFVDYEEGQISFYNVEAKSHIYSFIGCTFTEKLCPYFSPDTNESGKNYAALIITPVNL